MTYRWYEYQPEELLMNGKVHKVYNPIKKILKATVKGRKVLDVGCNAGSASLLSSHYGADKVTGVDVTDSYIEMANMSKKRWVELGRASDNVTFKNENVCNDLSLMDECDYFIFLRVLYHIRNTEEKTDEGLKNGVESVFEKLRGRKDALILLQGNKGRRKYVDNSKGLYGNNLATAKNMDKFLEQYGFMSIILGGEIVFAIHNESHDFEMYEGLLK